MTTFVLPTPMCRGIVQGRVPKLGVQRLPEPTRRGLPQCVTSEAAEVTSAASPSLPAGPHLSKRASTYMVLTAGMGGTCFWHRGKEGATNCIVVD